MGDGPHGDPELEERWTGWMAAAQAGDRDAYQQLLRSLLPALRGFVYRRVRDPAAVEDVVQNVLLAVHRARHTYRPERPFGPWWRAIARNASIDHGRQLQRRSGREVTLDGIEVADDREIEWIPESLSPRLRAALDQLPPNQRQAVELIQLEGLSVAEAAERVGITPGALKVRAHRGYQALRKSLEGVSS